MATSSEIDTTSLVASLVPPRPRMITRSRNSPSNGPSTSRSTSTATSVGQCQASCICQ